MLLASAGAEAGHAAGEVLRLGIHGGFPVGQVLWAAVLVFAVVFVVVKLGE